MNTIEKYLAKAANLDSVKSGMDIRCNVSYVAAHDVTAPIAIKQFREIGVKKVFDPKRVIMIVDHIYPAATEKARENVWIMTDFAREFGLPIYQRGEGVTHQLMYEKHRAKPGELVVIADSHTCTCGGYGAVGIGVGSTEVAAAMAIGKLDLEVPAVVQVCLSGKPAANVFGKDLILYLGQLFGSNYLTDRGLLITGPGIDCFSVEERMTICNMGIELGSMITLFGGRERETDVAETREIDLSQLKPKVARPFSPANVCDVAEIANLPITQAIVGSCTNGRENDMEQVVKVLKKNPVHPDVNMLVIPSSKIVLDVMERNGWTRIIRDAGATIVNPGCGPCFGSHEGLITERDTVISTTNRNFPGRMGANKGQVYLASPATVAASAVTGKITEPANQAL